MPPSIVLKIPPEAAPTYDTSGLPGSPTTAMARFPSGPINRNERFLNGCGVGD
jgi:hypothetical protein